MRILVTSMGLLALLWTLATPVLAQNALRYDPIMEKRADLPLQWLRAQREAAEIKEQRSKRHIYNFRREADRTETPLVTALGSPYLIDFQARSNKRADLRIDVARHGLDSAFTDWLRREHPLAYQQYVRDIAH